MTMGLDEISNDMHAIRHQYANSKTCTIFASCLLKLPCKDAVKLVKRCGATDGSAVIALLMEFSEDDDVSRIHGYFIGVSERWTEKNPHVMDACVNPRRVQIRPRRSYATWTR